MPILPLNIPTLPKTVASRPMGTSTTTPNFFTSTQDTLHFGAQKTPATVEQDIRDMQQWLKKMNQQVAKAEKNLQKFNKINQKTPFDVSQVVYHKPLQNIDRDWNRLIDLFGESPTLKDAALLELKGHQVHHVGNYITGMTSTFFYPAESIVDLLRQSIKSGNSQEFLSQTQIQAKLTRYQKQIRQDAPQALENLQTLRSHLKQMARHYELFPKQDKAGFIAHTLNDYFKPERESGRLTLTLPAGLNTRGISLSNMKLLEYLEELVNNSLKIANAKNKPALVKVEVKTQTKLIKIQDKWKLVSYRVIQVTDNGKSVSPHFEIGIGKRENNTLPGGGTGLAQVQKQLTKYCGSLAMLTLKPRPDGQVGSVVTLELPLTE